MLLRGARRGPCGPRPQGEPCALRTASAGSRSIRVMFDRERRPALRARCHRCRSCEDATPDELATEELGRLAGHVLDFAAKWAGSSRASPSASGTIPAPCSTTSSNMRARRSGSSIRGHPLRRCSPAAAGSAACSGSSSPSTALKAVARAAGGSTNDALSRRASAVPSRATTRGSSCPSNRSRSGFRSAREKRATPPAAIISSPPCSPHPSPCAIPPPA